MSTSGRIKVLVASASITLAGCGILPMSAVDADEALSCGSWRDEAITVFKSTRPESVQTEASVDWWGAFAWSTCMAEQGWVCYGSEWPLDDALAFNKLQQGMSVSAEEQSRAEALQTSLELQAILTTTSEDSIPMLVTKVDTCSKGSATVVLTGLTEAKQ